MIRDRAVDAHANNGMGEYRANLRRCQWQDLRTALLLLICREATYHRAAPVRGLLNISNCCYCD